MKLAELTNVDQLQVELIRHGWQQCVDHPPQITSPVFSYSEDICPCCGAICRIVGLYPQHGDLGTTVWLQGEVNGDGQIVSWSHGEAYGPTCEEFEQLNQDIDPISIANSINSWIVRTLG